MGEVFPGGQNEPFERQNAGVDVDGPPPVLRAGLFDRVGGKLDFRKVLRNLNRWLTDLKNGRLLQLRLNTVMMTGAWHSWQKC